MQFLQKRATYFCRSLNAFRSEPIHPASKGCPGEPVFAGKGFSRALIAVAVLIGIGVSRSESLAAICALGAVLLVVGSVLLAACLLAVLAVRAVLGICYVSYACACITVLADRAIRSGCYVCRAGDGLGAVLANGTVSRGGRVRSLSYSAADVTFRVTKVGVLVLCTGDRLTAVFAGQTVGCKCLMAVAGTNVPAKVADHVVLVGVLVRCLALVGAAVAGRVAVVGVGMSKRLLAFHGLLAACEADGAYLMKNLGVVTVSGGLDYPVAEAMLNRSGFVATVALGVASVLERVSKRLLAFLSLLSLAKDALSGENLCVVTVRGGLFCPFNTGEVVRNGSYRVADVTFGVAIVVIGVSKRDVAVSGLFLVAFGAGTSLNLSVFAVSGGLGCPSAKAVLVAGGITAAAAYRAVVSLGGVAERDVAVSGLVNDTVRAVTDLNLCIVAVSGRQGLPSAELVCDAACLAADAAYRTIVCIGLVAGAFTVVAAIVTFKILDAVIVVRRNARKSASVDTIRCAIACVVVSVRGIALLGLFHLADAANADLNLCFVAVSGRQGLPSAELVIKAACLAADRADRAVFSVLAVSVCILAGLGLFKTAAFNGANAVQDLCIHAVFGSQRLPLAECVNDHSYVIAIRTVTGGVTIVVIFVTESGSAVLYVLCAANVAESVKDLSGGTGNANLDRVISHVGVGDLSLVAALCTVALRVAGIGEVMADRSRTFLGLGLAAVRTVSGKDLCVLAVGGGGGLPIAECVYVLANGAAGVTFSITAIVINVIVYRSLYAADVTVGIACVVVDVRLCVSERAAKVTVSVAGEGVNAIRGSGVLRAADVAGKVTGIGVNVRIRDPERAADVTVLVAAVGVNVLGYSQRATELAVCIAIVGVNVVGSLAGLLTNVTFAVTGRVEYVSRSLSARLAAYGAFGGAGTYVGVRNRLAGLAANVTVDVCAAVVGMIGLALAHLHVTFVTDRIAGTVINVVGAEASRKREEHQHNGQCTE